jgi:hypothetical protein
MFAYKCMPNMHVTFDCNIHVKNKLKVWIFTCNFAKMCNICLGMNKKNHLEKETIIMYGKLFSK